MASSAQLKNPSRIIFLLFSLSILFFIVTAFCLTELSKTQSHKLLTYEVSILVRGNGRLLLSGNLRAFVEAISLNHDAFYIEIKSRAEAKTFLFGNSSLLDSSCVSVPYYEYDIRYCRPYAVPWESLYSIAGLYFLFLLATLRFLKKLNENLLKSFKDFFGIVQIPFSNDMNLGKAWDITFHLADTFSNSRQKIIDLEKEKTHMAIARQVAHDIRSPLAALEVFLRETNQTDSLAVKALARIKGIANDLLSRPNLAVDSVITISNKDVEKFDIRAASQSIVAEKNALIANFKIGLVARDRPILLVANESAFSRILSNILNNSIESLGESRNPKIEVILDEFENHIFVTIRDNGCGIPKNILEKIGEEGFSHGKTNGHGLGIFSAKNWMESIGGELIINSHLGLGTQVILKFPGRIQ